MQMKVSTKIILRTRDSFLLLLHVGVGAVLVEDEVAGPLEDAQHVLADEQAAQSGATTVRPLVVAPLWAVIQ